MNITSRGNRDIDAEMNAHVARGTEKLSGKQSSLDAELAQHEAQGRRRLETGLPSALSNFNPDVLRIVGDNYKASWTYDNFDPEDVMRQSMGVMPKSLEKKYNFKDPIDVALYNAGQPYKSKTNTDYNKAFAEYAKNESALWERDNSLSKLQNELYPKIFEAEKSELARAVEEGRDPYTLSYEDTIAELLSKPEYSPVLDNFLFPVDNEDKEGLAYAKAVRSERNALEKAEANPLTLTMEDLLSGYEKYKKQYQLPAIEEEPEVSALTLYNEEISSAKSIHNGTAPESALLPQDTIAENSAVISALKSRNEEILAQTQQPGFNLYDADTYFGGSGYLGSETQQLNSILSTEYDANEKQIAALEKEIEKAENEIIKSQKDEYKAVSSANMSELVSNRSDYELYFEGFGEGYVEAAEADLTKAAEIRATAREGLAENGITSSFQQDNVLRRNGIAIPHGEELKNYYDENYAPSSLDVFDPTNADFMDKLETAFETDTRVQELPEIAATKAVLAAPVHGAYSIAQGLTGVGEMVTSVVKGDTYVRPEWLEGFYNIGREIHGFGMTDGYTASNLAFQVGSEVTRMYLTAGIGHGVANAASGVDFLANSFANRAISMSPFVMTSVGNSFLQAANNGATPEQAMLYGIVAGGMEGALESLGADLMIQNIWGTAKWVEAGRKGLTSAGANKFVQVASSVIGNGLEEGASYVINGLAELMIYNPEWRFSGKEFLEDAGMGMLIGFVGAAMDSSGDARKIYQDMAENGFTAEKFDDMAFAVMVENMPEAKKENVKYSALLSNEEYIKTINSVAEAVQSIENAKTNRAEYLNRYKAELSKAEKAYTEKAVKIKQLDPNDPQYGKKMEEGVVELASSQRTLENTQASTEAKVAGVKREYDSITANNEAQKTEAQRKLDNHALAHDAERKAKEVAEIVTNIIEPSHASDVENQPPTATPETSMRPALDNNIPQMADAMQEPNLSMGNAVLGEFDKYKIVSDTYETLRKKFGDEKLIEAGITPELMSYFASSEESSLAGASHDIEKAKQGMLAEMIEKMTKADFWNDTSTDTAFGLIGVALENEDYASARMAADELRLRNTEAGQAIQANAKYGRTAEGFIVEALTETARTEEKAPKSTKDSIKKETEEVSDILKDGTDVEKKLKKAVAGKNSKSAIEAIMDMFEKGNFTDAKINDVIKTKYGLPVLTDPEITRIKELIGNAEAAPDGSREQDVNYLRAAQIVADKLPKTGKNQHRAVRRIMMMLNPKTMIRNFTANIPMGILENIKDIPGTMADIVASQFTGERTTSLTPNRIVAQAQGFKKGITDAVMDMRDGVDTSGMPGKYEGVQAEPFKPNTAVGRTFNWLNQKLGNLMQLGDRGFFQSAFADYIAQQEALGNDVNSKEALQAATDYALDRVFQNDSTLARSATDIRNKMGIVGDWLMPFTQTPANIADKLIDYTPVGLGRAVVQLGKETKRGEFNQKLFVDRVGRSLTGTGILFFGAALAAKGLLRGDEDETAKEYKAYEMAGEQQYALKIGDKSYTINWAEPVGSLLLIGAHLHNSGLTFDNLDELSAEAWGDLGINVARVGIDSFFNNSFLQNISDAMSSGSPSSFFETLLLGTSSQYTPSSVAAIARSIDPMERETYDPSKLQQYINRVMARVPGLREQLPVKINTAGQEISAGETGERIFENLASPFNVASETDDPVNLEVYRLYQESGLTDQLFPVAAKKIDGIELSADEYHQYQIDLGRAAHEGALEAISNSSYGTKSDADKAEAIRKKVRSKTDKVKDAWKEILKGETT